MNCVQCQKLTDNPKFCSKSCSVRYNNSAKPKRQLTRICLYCDKSVSSYRSNRCDFHLKTKQLTKELTIGEYRNRLSVTNQHRSSLHSHIRNFARAWLKHLTKLPCKHCGYDKHVELAHIKPLNSFLDSALLKEVNAEDNVIQLCPNCHWEFDNAPRVGVEPT